MNQPLNPQLPGDSTTAIAKLLVAVGLLGAIVLPAVSWIAGIASALIAVAGWVVLVRRRPRSRWARGWTAFRHPRR